MKRRLIPAIALMAAVMVGDGSLSFAAGDTPDGPPVNEQVLQKKFFQKMAVRLKLTDAQKEQIRALFKEASAQTRPLREQQLNNRRQLRQLTEADSFDETAVKSLAAEQGQLHAQLLVTRTRLLYQVNKVLTPEQREQAKRMRADMMNKRRFHRPQQES